MKSFKIKTQLTAVQSRVNESIYMKKGERLGKLHCLNTFILVVDEMHFEHGDNLRRCELLTK
ncbi:MAG: hypothetical protein AAF717_21385 [Bacteroidota bacterium]|nr:hypothetical protein [uncultured Allomuricauda sp.]